jgi:hypothetical protein
LLQNVKGKITFKERNNELLFLTDLLKAEFQAYDSADNIILLDIGNLYQTRPNLFQLQSIKKGIILLEADNLQDKAEFFALVNYLSSNETTAPGILTGLLMLRDRDRNARSRRRYRIHRC